MPFTEKSYQAEDDALQSSEVCDDAIADQGTTCQ